MLFCMLLATSVFAQENLDAGYDDPYIDPKKTITSFKQNNNVEFTRKYLLGICKG